MRKKHTDETETVSGRSPLTPKGGITVLKECGNLIIWEFEIEIPRYLGMTSSCFCPTNVLIVISRLDTKFLPLRYRNFTRSDEWFFTLLLLLRWLFFLFRF